MKKLLGVYILFIGLLTAMTSCSSEQIPNCTMRQLGTGKYEMLNNNCQNCSAINVIDAQGRKYAISLNEASQRLSLPSAYGSVGDYNSQGNNTLETILLHQLMFNNPSYYNNNTGLYNRYSYQYTNYKTTPYYTANLNKYKEDIAEKRKVRDIDNNKTNFFKSNGFSKPTENKKVNTYVKSGGFSKPIVNTSIYKKSDGFSKQSINTNNYKKSTGFKSSTSSKKK